MEELIKEIEAISTVASLKAELSDASVAFNAKANKAELVELVAKLRSGEELPKAGEELDPEEDPHKGLAKQLFEQYENVDEFYITKDGQPFANKDKAEGHGTGYTTYKR